MAFNATVLSIAPLGDPFYPRRVCYFGSGSALALTPGYNVDW